MDAWTYEDLQAKKTELIANMAVVSDMARSRAAARIELLDELMERIKPKLAEITANGVIDAQGESGSDVWRLKVVNNKVTRVKGRVVFTDA